jgi:hypothetical protein
MIVLCFMFSINPTHPPTNKCLEIDTINSTHPPTMPNYYLDHDNIKQIYINPGSKACIDPHIEPVKTLRQKYLIPGEKTCITRSGFLNDSLAKTFNQNSIEQLYINPGGKTCVNPLDIAPEQQQWPVAPEQQPSKFWPSAELFNEKIKSLKRPTIQYHENQPENKHPKFWSSAELFNEKIKSLKRPTIQPENKHPKFWPSVELLNEKIKSLKRPTIQYQQNPLPEYYIYGNKFIPSVQLLTKKRKLLKSVTPNKKVEYVLMNEALLEQKDNLKSVVMKKKEPTFVLKEVPREEVIVEEVPQPTFEIAVPMEVVEVKEVPQPTFEIAVPIPIKRELPLLPPEIIETIESYVGMPEPEQTWKNLDEITQEQKKQMLEDLQKQQEAWFALYKKAHKKKAQKQIDQMLEELRNAGKGKGLKIN